MQRLGDRQSSKRVRSHFLDATGEEPESTAYGQHPGVFDGLAGTEALQALLDECIELRFSLGRNQRADRRDQKVDVLRAWNTRGLRG